MKIWDPYTKVDTTKYLHLHPFSLWLFFEMRIYLMGCSIQLGSHPGRSRWLLVGPRSVFKNIVFEHAFHPSKSVRPSNPKKIQGSCPSNRTATDWTNGTAHLAVWTANNSPWEQDLSKARKISGSSWDPRKNQESSSSLGTGAAVGCFSFIFRAEKKYIICATCCISKSNFPIHPRNILKFSHHLPKLFLILPMTNWLNTQNFSTCYDPN